MSGDAVHDQPSPALPAPAHGCFLGQSIVHANHTPYHEDFLSYFMRTPESKFFQPRIHVQRSNLQLLDAILVDLRERLDDRPFSESNNMWLRGTQCCRCEKEKEKTKTDAKKKTHPLRLSIDHQPAQGQIAHGVQRLCAE